MKLTELRRRLAAALTPDNDRDDSYPAKVTPPEPDPLDEPSIDYYDGPPPLTPDQRANLENLRDRYAPDRQKRRP